MLKFALLLCLTAGACHASEITINHIVKAVCAVETGTNYRWFGHVDGRWSVGRAGEEGPWQVTPMVLLDMGLSPKRRRGVDSYEVAFRGWYAHLLRKTGSHEEALAAYHRGLGGRHREDAKAYAQRCMNLAAEYAKDAK